MASFNPDRPGATITLAETVYVIEPHPQAPQMPYASEGRFGTVWKLRRRHDGRLFALKVYKRPRKRAETRNLRRVQSLRDIFGLTVLDQQFLQPEQVRGTGFEDDLKYALLMPWINGKTWFEILGDQDHKEHLEDQDCLTASRTLCQVLVALEKQGGAHADVSSSNVMVQSDRGGTELIDAEDMFLPELIQPPLCPAGTDGYRHRSLTAGHQWHAHGDRFAGGVLICEMLGWRSLKVREVADPESYFNQAEDLEATGPGGRAEVLRDSLAEWDVRLVPLFERLMRSTTLADCPSFAEWQTVFTGLHVGRPLPRYDDHPVNGPVHRTRKISLPPVKPPAPRGSGGRSS